MCNNYNQFNKQSYIDILILLNFGIKVSLKKKYMMNITLVLEKIIIIIKFMMKMKKFYSF